MAERQRAIVSRLPPNYRTRLKTLPARGNLWIAVLHRQDVLVMKFFAGRIQDMDDIAALRPTDSELEFVRSDIPRLARLDAARATRMESVLDAFRGRTR